MSKDYLIAISQKEKFKGLGQDYLTMTKTELEDKYKHGYGYLRQLANRQGAKAPSVRKMLLFDCADELVKLYTEDKKSIPALAKLYNCSLTAVQNMLRKKGVVRRPAHPNKYSYDQTYFSTMDSHNKYYFLGFIMADGYLDEKDYYLDIRLNPKDREVLEEFKKELKTEAPLNTKKISARAGGEKSYERVRLQVNSRKMVADLRALGVTRNKSFDLKFPEVPEQYLSAFMRGLWDGDGCIGGYDLDRGRYCVMFHFIGAKDVVHRFREELNKHTGLADGGTLKSRLAKDGEQETWDMRYGGGQQLLKIFKFMYSDPGFRLSRKYEKFKAIVEEIIIREMEND